MLFNSLDFFIFLGLLLPTYFLLPRWWQQQVLLLAGSLFFYAYWNVPFTGLLLASALTAYAVARAMDATRVARVRRCLLAIGVLTSLAVLCYFKYWNFFLDSVNTAAGLELRPVDVLLPLGISFYTFQAISYVVDVYRGDVRAERSPLRVVLYISFFPQLVAGPIVRAKDFLPQLSKPPSVTHEDVAEACRRILAGILKKVIVADNLAVVVNTVYAEPGAYSAPMLLLATYAFAVQIYCDFSAYSDIAIGVARLFGFRLDENFNNPYISQSIQEFWRRWHISLSRWLRDYLYIPLGGSRFGTWRTYRNLMITMVLGGLWHGASVNFLIWGTMHGLWLSAERMVAGRMRCVEKVPPSDTTRLAPRAVRVLLVFHGVCLTWIFFRAQNTGDALSIIAGLCTWQAGEYLPPLDLAMQALACMAAVVWFAFQGQISRQSRAWYPLAAYGCVAIVVFGASSSEFIYFVF